MRRLLLFSIVATLLAGSSLALAAELTRTEYKNQVEPICKQNSEASGQILKGVRTKVRQGKLDAAGRQLIRAAAALRNTLSQLKTVPRPTVDETLLGDWLRRVGQEADLLEQAGRALKAGKTGRAERLQAQLYAGAKATNALVTSFSFHYCRFEPSKYT